MTCMEMFGSGAAIGMVAIQRVCCETLRALRMVRDGSPVAEAGSATAGSCVRRTGTGSRRATRAPPWASVSVSRFYSQKRSDTEVAGRPGRSQAGRATGAERSCHYPARFRGSWHPIRGVNCLVVVGIMGLRTYIAPQRGATLRTVRLGRGCLRLKTCHRGRRSTGPRPRLRCRDPGPS